MRKYQEEVLKLDSEEVKALFLLDNEPAHPSTDKLISDEGKIRVMFLLPNTTSIIQPKDQGVIVACKKLYHISKTYLDEVAIGCA